MQKRQPAKKKGALAERVLGRNLPFSTDAERAVLGSLLLNDNYLDGVLEILTVQDFYKPGNQTIFAAMMAIGNRKERLDIITLQDELDKENKLGEIGGTSYLLSLQEDIPAVGLVEQHAKIIKEKAVLRELI